MTPDILEIEPLTRPATGTVTIPGSKSITNRALILAALSEQRCRLRGALWADDTQVMVECLRRLGFDVSVEADPSEESNRTIEVVGQGGRIPVTEADLDVGMSGTTARFIAALVASGKGTYRLGGHPRICQRPMGELFGALRQLGAEVDGDHLPATIRANGLRRDVPVRVSAKESSQFASALRLVDVPVTFAESDQDLSYVEMTERMRREFSSDYAIEPDMSSASYFFAAGFVTGGKVEVAGCPVRSLQVDGRFAQFLPPPPVVSRARDLGDSVMTAAMCALFGKQPVMIAEAGRLRLQECDRIAALAAELTKVGARVEEGRDWLKVWPAEPGHLHGAEIETYNDHRMAMCFGVLGLKLAGVRIKNPACVKKTFPNFFAKLAELRR
jgi:3-phosphoshikimate 1-carboxyvinyltransferase